MTGRRGSYPLPFLINANLTTPPPVLTRTFGGSLTAGSGNATMTLPSGGEGQLLVAMIGYRDSPQFSMPTGWTVVYQASVADTAPSGQVSICVARKTRAALEFDPVFTRTGGGSAAGYVVGYAPNYGSLTFNAFTQNNNGGSTSTTHSTGSLTSAGTRSLLICFIVKSFFWTTAASGLSAASLAATATTGTLVTEGDAVLTTPWQNDFFAARSIGNVVGTQGFDLLREGAGASGTISVAGVPNTPYHAVGMDFGWL